MNTRNEPNRPPRFDASLFNEAPDPVIGLDVDRADALMPTDILQGDETVVLLLKPSPWFILLGCLGTLCVIVGVSIGVLAFQRWFDPVGYNPSGMMTLATVLAAGAGTNVEDEARV